MFNQTAYLFTWNVYYTASAMGFKQTPQNDVRSQFESSHNTGRASWGRVSSTILSKIRLGIMITIAERSPSSRVTGQSIDTLVLAVETVGRYYSLSPFVRGRYMKYATLVKDSARFNSGTSVTVEHEILRADIPELFLEGTKPSGICIQRFR